MSLVLLVFLLFVGVSFDLVSGYRSGHNHWVCVLRQERYLMFKFQWIDGGEGGGFGGGGEGGGGRGRRRARRRRLGQRARQRRRGGGGFGGGGEGSGFGGGPQGWRPRWRQRASGSEGGKIDLEARAKWMGEKSA